MHPKYLRHTVKSGCVIVSSIESGRSFFSLRCCYKEVKALSSRHDHDILCKKKHLEVNRACKSGPHSHIALNKILTE